MLGLDTGGVPREVNPHRRLVLNPEIWGLLEQLDNNCVANILTLSHMAVRFGLAVHACRITAIPAPTVVGITWVQLGLRRVVGQATGSTPTVVGTATELELWELYIQVLGVPALMVSV